MRYFRIPNFTGIEAHRDDADRGSLRVVEGCLPQGPGGVSSGPVWEKVGDVDTALLSTDKNLAVTSSADENGNAFLFASRHSEVHDIHYMPEPNTVLGELEEEVEIYKSDGEMDQRKSYFNSIGNRTLMIGEGSTNPLAVGKGPPREVDKKTSYDGVIYSLEWSVFKRCKYFVIGPNKTIFAAGSCLEPMSVYVSEPAGLTTPFRDSPYSMNDISKVDILMSNATIITGLSVLNNQVIVHTDDGCHILYEPKADQAETGYRTEQKPSSVFSGAVNNAVVNRGCGSSPFWLGHDKSIYKDESSKRGQDEKDENTDRDQASYKSKGAWEHELPQNLENSFGVYDPFSGSYIVYVESREHLVWREFNEKTIIKEDDFVCPADEDVPGSDPIIIEHPEPNPEPDPVRVQPPEEPTIPGDPVMAEPCGADTVTHSGGKSYPEPHIIEFDLGPETGEVTLEVDPITHPDRFVVEFDGEKVIDTGFLSKDPAAGQSEMGEAEGEEIIDWHESNGIFKFEKKSRNAIATLKVYAPGSMTKWNVKMSCPDPDIGQPTACPLEDGISNFVIGNTFYLKAGRLSKETLDCLIDYYDRDDLRDELHELFDKSVEWGVPVWIGNPITTDATAVYIPGASGANSLTGKTLTLMGGASTGLIMIHASTLPSDGSNEPLDQFTQSFRHEIVHAAQDFEAGITNVFVQTVSTDNKKIFNQHGQREVDKFYSTKSAIVQALELEANSAEIDMELVRLAFELAEDGI